MCVYVFSSSCEEALPLDVSQALMDVMSEQLQGLLHAVHQQEVLERNSTESIPEETPKQESESLQDKIQHCLCLFAIRYVIGLLHFVLNY